MTPRSFIAPKIARLLTSRTLRAWRRHRSEWRRKFSRRPHEVHYFHQADDPYSHLLLQLLPQFRSSYNVTVHMHLVAPPDDDAAPERVQLEDFSRRDAAEIAPFHGLQFTDPEAQPSKQAYEFALRAMAASSDIINAALPISTAYWENDVEGLKNMPMLSKAEAQERMVRGTKRRNELGHYLGGMLYYGGEWYWGVDRLPYLEARLDALRARHIGCREVTRFQTRPAFMPKPARRRLTLEFYPSARSPYSYLAMEETYRLAEDYPINVVTRPVLPMVMRGLPVPSRKGRYIMMDCTREADRIGVRFGNVSDPVGTPILRGYSLFPYADSQGKGGAFLTAFTQLAWSEGVNLASDAGLRRAAERAGLDWGEAQKHLDSEDWKEIEAKNRQQLSDSGLWGVPSYRLLDEKGKPIYEVWGRDRIWLVAHKIQEALAE